MHFHSRKVRYQDINLSDNIMASKNAVLSKKCWWNWNERFESRNLKIDGRFQTSHLILLFLGRLKCKRKCTRISNIIFRQLYELMSCASTFILFLLPLQAPLNHNTMMQLCISALNYNESWAHELIQLLYASRLW